MFWEKWMWKSLSMGQSFLTTLHLDGLDPTQPARLRMRAWGINQCAPCNRPRHLLDVTLNNAPRLTEMALGHRRRRDARHRCSRRAAAHAPGGRQQPAPGRAGGRGLQRAPGSLRRSHGWTCSTSAASWSAGDKLAFDSPAAQRQLSRFVVDGFADAAAAARVRRHRPRAAAGARPASRTLRPAPNWRLTFERSQGDRRRYRILPDTAIVTLPREQHRGRARSRACRACARRRSAPITW